MNVWGFLYDFTVLVCSLIFIDYELLCVGVVKAPRWSGSLDAMLGSVVVFRSATGAVAEVIVPFGLAKAGLFSGCSVVLGVVAASEEGSEDA